MNIIVLGKPGSGKGSVAREFRDRSDMIHLSTGDLFRKEIAAKTELGILADSFISKGQLVPDEVTNDIIKNILQANKDKHFLFDGYPRTLVQAKAFKEMLAEIGMKLDGVFDLEVSDSVVIERLTSRRVCSKCGMIYNTRNHNPKVEGVCDECGGEIIQRDDDKIEAITNRLVVYQNQTKPLINFYTEEGLLYKVNGGQEAYGVYLDIMKVIQ